MTSESFIWTEKYRPQDFSAIVGQDDIVSRIKILVTNRNIPHLLFAGPAGVGKTTLALVICKELYGPGWKDNILELNASDERGIDVIRNKVKDFARTRSIGDVPFKIIYLDECDALTKEAQQALRRTMENFAQNCRFILSCNYSSKIIDPIQSRCAMFRFRPLEKEGLSKIIKDIAKKESIRLTDGAVSAIYNVSGGDCRKAENILQGAASAKSEIDEADIYMMASYAEPKEIAEVLRLASANEFLKARKLLLDIMLRYGLAGLDIIKQIQKEIWNLDIDDRMKVTLVDKCGEIEFRMVEGSDEYIQLEALLAHFTLASG